MRRGVRSLQEADVSSDECPSRTEASHPPKSPSALRLVWVSRGEAYKVDSQDRLGEKVLAKEAATLGPEDASRSHF